MRIDQIASGARVFVDAPVFIYHFTGISRECKQFLHRCETADLDALTSSVVVAEVAHRLMMIEAVSEGLVTAGNVVRKLRDRPAAVRRLQKYQEQVRAIPPDVGESGSRGLRLAASIGADPLEIRASGQRFSGRDIGPGSQCLGSGLA